MPEGAVVEVEDGVRLDHDAGGAILGVKCVNRALVNSLGSIVDSCKTMTLTVIPRKDFFLQRFRVSKPFTVLIQAQVVNT